MENNKSIDEIDEILGDILDEKENTENTEEYTDETLVEAKKFLSLMEEFDVKQGSNMEENLRKNKQEIIEARTELQETNDNIPIEVNVSIVEADELLEDFILVRETLREDIKTTRLVLSKLGEDFATMSADEMNGQVVTAYAEIKKSNVKSMELLMGSYSNVAETQLKVKKLVQELKTVENENQQLENTGGTNIQNAVFVGSPDELLKSLKGN